MATVNRRVTNRIMGVAAPRLPGFGVVRHTGRHSGRPFRTPVNVFAADGGYVVALTYGARSDWVKNVMAAGGCELEHRGRRERLGSPRVVHDETRRMVPAAVRIALGVLHVTDFMTLRTEAGSDRRNSTDETGDSP
jgi:deazaflavin-dependent oxidoreductase (nitroreductase family)